MWVQKIPLWFWNFFPKRLEIFNQCLHNTRWQIFIQVSPTVIKLCHTKRNHLVNCLLSKWRHCWHVVRYSPRYLQKAQLVYTSICWVTKLHCLPASMRVLSNNGGWCLISLPVVLPRPPSLLLLTSFGFLYRIFWCLFASFGRLVAYLDVLMGAGGEVHHHTKLTNPNPSHNLDNDSNLNPNPNPNSKFTSPPS